MSDIYFDAESDADELIRMLHEEGYRTTFRQEGFAGEDDSEDRQWVLTVEPFDDAVVEMVDVYGGWLPGDEHLPRAAFELPDEPKKLKD